MALGGEVLSPHVIESALMLIELKVDLDKDEARIFTSPGCL